MAHIEQLEFFNRVFKSFPEVFLNASSKVIDIGSLDINGGPHELLDLDYLGTDIGEGRNVNLVCPSPETLMPQYLANALSTILSGENL